MKTRQNCNSDKETPVQVFSSKFCEIFKNSFLTEQVWTTGFGFFFIRFTFFLPLSELTETRFSYFSECFSTFFERDEYYEFCNRKTIKTILCKTKEDLKHLLKLTRKQQNRSLFFNEVTRQRVTILLKKGLRVQHNFSVWSR